jgi:hypothetical protein
LPQAISVNGSPEILSIHDSGPPTIKGTRIIVKFNHTVDLPYVDSLEEQFVTLGLSGLAEIFDEYPGMTVGRLIVNVTAERIKELEELARANHDNNSTKDNESLQSESLLTYFRVIIPPDVDINTIIERLRNEESIEKLYFEDEPELPHFDTRLKDPMTDQQGYLGAAPKGIDAFAAWKEYGGAGTNVVFADIEGGWKLNHEDLRTISIKILPPGEDVDMFNWISPTITKEDAFMANSHGTETLGVVVGTGHNKKGVIGIAHDTEGVILCSDTYGSIVDAITLIADELISKGRKGDILLIEAHLPKKKYGNQDDFLPVEVEEANYKAIKMATDLGIIVIEPAGNGSVGQFPTKKKAPIKSTD